MTHHNKNEYNGPHFVRVGNGPPRKPDELEKDRLQLEQYIGESEVETVKMPSRMDA